MRKPMTLEEFVLALERWGAALDRWPPSMRESAATLLAASPKAADALQRAQALEDHLRSNDPAARITSARCAAVNRRIIAAIVPTAATSHRAQEPWWRLFLPSAPVRLPVMRFAATALTVAVLGVLAGRGITQANNAAVTAFSSVDAEAGPAAMFSRAPMLTAAAL